MSYGWSPIDATLGRLAAAALSGFAGIQRSRLNGLSERAGKVDGLVPGRQPVCQAGLSRRQVKKQDGAFLFGLADD